MRKPAAIHSNTRSQFPGILYEYLSTVEITAVKIEWLIMSLYPYNWEIKK